MREFSTPMMQQYREIKDNYTDCLLFFRLGDFYELFMEDAEIGSRVLDITLTSRDRGSDGRIPMAGVPYHAVENYISRLVKEGHKVAICEQITPPGQGLVKREVVRIITPGTVMTEESLDKKSNNILLSIHLDKKGLGMAYSDISTGLFKVFEHKLSTNGDADSSSLSSVFLNEIARINPVECVVSDELYNNSEFLELLTSNLNTNVFPYSEWEHYAENAEKTLKEHFEVDTLDGFGIGESTYAQTAASALLGYLKHTQKAKVAHINDIKLVSNNECVGLDKSTITNLELFSTIRERNKFGSLINFLDRTSTSMGGRLLKDWVLKPLTKKNEIEDRQSAVEVFVNEGLLQRDLVEDLTEIMDIERLLAKLAVGVGNAKDLVNLKNSLVKSLEIKHKLGGVQNKYVQMLSNQLRESVSGIIALVERALVAEPPLDLKNGGLINIGFDEPLDDLRNSILDSQTFMLDLEKKERERTGISSLKVKYNQVFGYYIEITKSNLKFVPENYFRKQTLVNAERFFTEELKHHEEIILTAKDKINDREYEIFLDVVSKTLSYTKDIQETAKSIGTLDCLLNFSFLALKNNYVEPSLIESGELEIIDGRHPVVEALLNDTFVPNDTHLNIKDNQLHILTGPNMAGKSVYIRQVALIVLLAHIGSYVPAKSAKISLVDKIFVRSGASDVITSGLSTFMVEMVETANILNNASSQSLIVMDEIGRGTSTYDGISLAQSIVEYLVGAENSGNSNIRPKTLFATHYHELQKLESKHKGVKNYQVLAKEEKTGPVFLHKVVEGGSDHSYGIAVAKLAGVPDVVTTRAREILKELEKKA